MLDFLCSRDSLDFHVHFTGVWEPMFVFDRGYASKNFISYIEDVIQARYLFRVKSKFNADIDALPAPSDQHGISDHVIFLDGRKIRVLKFYLPSGGLETLITNDFDFAISRSVRDKKGSGESNPRTIYFIAALKYH